MGGRAAAVLAWCAAFLSSNKQELPSMAAKKPAKIQATVTLNPATGEAIKIKASKKVAFRAAKDLKEAV